MVFSTLLFLLCFLPLVMLTYQLVPHGARNVVLLVSSLAFYAWAGPRFVPLIMGEALVSWAAALLMERSEDVSRRRALLAAGCAVLLGLLAYFKYLGLLLGTTHALFGIPAEVVAPVLPVGISFYTFQLISYQVDVYRGSISAQRAYWKLLLYCSLFHQCIAGPIVRYETIAAEIDGRKATKGDVYLGVRRFCVGLAKKALLANACASVADALVPASSLATFVAQPVAGYWLGMLFYALQIYLDFSAYSDMAIGLGRMVGFHYLENFDHPYQSASVQEFWRRWHISLGTFFRDYVYIPLGGSRCSTGRLVRNMAVVWLLTGLWHGASWNYLLWGAYYLAFLLLERFVVKGRAPKPLAWPGTLLVVVVGWVLFRFEDFGVLVRVLGGMVGIGAPGLGSLAVRTTLAQNVFLLAASVVACTELGSRVRHRMAVKARTSELALRVLAVTDAVTPVALLLASIVALAGASYNPFIYFQF